MSITAKEIASILHISEAAVSMALNGKPGVSRETKAKILDTAHSHGYDFTKIKQTKKKNGSIYFLMYKKHGAVVGNTDFFETLTEGLDQACREHGYKLIILHLIEDGDILEQMTSIIQSDCVGILLLGTEMYKEDFFPFAYIQTPIVLLDTYFRSTKMDCVLINNVEGACQATKYLVQKRQTHPGYLHSSYPIQNFEERADGYYKALRECGLSSSASTVHRLPPSMEGAYSEMLSLLKSGVKPADCYFSDNDLIAAGAMKAFKEQGYLIPDDIGIIGFDNINLCTYLDPPLTTMNVPIRYMGKMAVERLLSILDDKNYAPIKLEVNTDLIKRKSV